MEFKISNERIYGVEESIMASRYPMNSKEEDFPEYSDDDQLCAFKDEEGGTIDVFADGYGENFINPNPIKIKTVSGLSNAESGSGHDNFLKGIVVQFDVTYPVYWSPQLQRYHFLDVVSSSSAMHRLTKIDVRKGFNEFTHYQVVELVKKMIDIYNEGVKCKEPFLIEETNIEWSTGCETYYNLVPVDIDKTMAIEKGDKENKKISYWTKEEFFQRMVATCPQGLMKTMRITTNALQLKTIYKQRCNHKLVEWRIFCDWIKSLYFWRLLDFKF